MTFSTPRCALFDLDYLDSARHHKLRPLSNRGKGEMKWQHSKTANSIIGA